MGVNRKEESDKPWMGWTGEQTNTFGPSPDGRRLGVLGHARWQPADEPSFDYLEFHVGRDAREVMVPR